MQFQVGQRVQLTWAAWERFREAHNETALRRFFGMDDLTEPPVGLVQRLIDRGRNRSHVRVLFNIDQDNSLTFESEKIIPLDQFVQRTFSEGG